MRNPVSRCRSGVACADTQNLQKTYLIYDSAISSPNLCEWNESVDRRREAERSVKFVQATQMDTQTYFSSSFITFWNPFALCAVCLRGRLFDLRLRLIITKITTEGRSASNLDPVRSQWLKLIQSRVRTRLKRFKFGAVLQNATIFSLVEVTRWFYGRYKGKNIWSLLFCFQIQAHRAWFEILIR